MKYNKGIIFFQVIAFSFFLSCNNELFIVEGRGSIVTEIIPISNFNGVDLQGVDNIFITQGKTQEVKVIGHPNIISRLKKTVSNDIWEVGLESDNYNNYELTIYITTPNIENLFISGSGDIKLNDFSNQNNLNLKISGSGQINLNKIEDLNKIKAKISGSGNISFYKKTSTLQELHISISGSGSFDGFNVTTKNCTIKNSASGFIKTTINGLLNISSSGSGNTYFKGNPTINKSISGSGRVIDSN